jgi:hypothetical protein
VGCGKGSEKQAPPAAQVLAAGSPEAKDVRDCRPCSFSPGPQQPVYEFTFDIATSAAGRAVRGIDAVNQKSRAKQHLEVKDMDAIGAEEDIFFGGADVNFDGYQDLMLITSRGVANAYAMYWLYNPSSGSYVALGNYPVLRMDSAAKKLTSYERGGSAGLEYDSKEYAFVDGNLTVLREEKQEATEKPGVFRKVIQERKDGAMKTVKTETVKAPR